MPLQISAAGAARDRVAELVDVGRDVRIGDDGETRVDLLRVLFADGDFLVLRYFAAGKHGDEEKSGEARGSARKSGRFHV